MLQNNHEAVALEEFELSEQICVHFFSGEEFGKLLNRNVYFRLKVLILVQLNFGGE